MRAGFNGLEGGRSVSFIFGIGAYFGLVFLGVHKAIAFVVGLLVAFVACYRLPKWLEKMPSLAHKLAEIKYNINRYFRFRGRR